MRHGRRQRFVEEYLVDLNATQAALRAGYSKKTAYAQGHRLLKDAEIQKAIQEAMAKRAKRTEITQDRVLDEIARCAFVDMRKLVEWGPSGVTVLDSSKVDTDTAMAVVEVGETRKRIGDDIQIETVKVKVADKLNALKLLMRHLGMEAPSKHEVTGKDGKDLDPSPVYVFMGRGRLASQDDTGG